MYQIQAILIAWEFRYLFFNYILRWVKFVCLKGSFLFYSKDIQIIRFNSIDLLFFQNSILLCIQKSCVCKSKVHSQMLSMRLLSLNSQISYYFKSKRKKIRSNQTNLKMSMEPWKNIFWSFVADVVLKAQILLPFTTNTFCHHNMDLKIFFVLGMACDMNIYV